MLTAYGIVALGFMMAMYALERRGRRFVLGFVLGCLLSSAYGFLSGAWPFGVIEAIWAGIALRRFLRSRHLVPPPVITVTFERTCIPDRGVARRLRTFQVRGALRALRSGRRMRSLRHRTSGREHYPLRNSVARAGRHE